MENIYENLPVELADEITEFLSQFDPDFVEFLRLLWVATVMHGDDETFNENIPEIIAHAKEAEYPTLPLMRLMHFIGMEMAGLYPKEAEEAWAREGEEEEGGYVFHGDVIVMPPSSTRQ